MVGLLRVAHFALFTHPGRGELASPGPTSGEDARPSVQPGRAGSRQVRSSEHPFFGMPGGDFSVGPSLLTWILVRPFAHLTSTGTETMCFQAGPRIRWRCPSALVHRTYFGEALQLAAQAAHTPSIETLGDKGGAGAGHIPCNVTTCELLNLPDAITVLNRYYLVFLLPHLPAVPACLPLLLLPVYSCTRRASLNVKNIPVDVD